MTAYSIRQAPPARTGHSSGCPCNSCDRYEAAREIAIDDAIQAAAAEHGESLVNELYDKHSTLAAHLDRFPPDNPETMRRLAQLMTEFSYVINAIDRKVSA